MLTLGREETESLWKELGVSPVMRISIKWAGVTTAEVVLSSREALGDQCLDRDRTNSATGTMVLSNVESGDQSLGS